MNGDYVGVVVQFSNFIMEHRRRQMASFFGQPSHRIGKAGFKECGLQIRSSVGNFPNLFGRRRVGYKHDRALRIFNEKSQSRHDMIDFDGGKF